jgi:CHAT domain-containing protein
VTPKDFVDKLLNLPDESSQRIFLREHASLLDDRTADALKEEADQILRADVQRSLETAALLQYLGDVSGNPHHRAMGLLAEANARSFGRAEHREAIEIYDQAASIYETHDHAVRQAQSQIGKLYALANLGQYTDALETGRWASRVLEKHAQWRLLAGLTVNLGIIHGRLGEDAEALALFDQSREQCSRLGPEGVPLLPLAEQNRAIVLRNLGQFEASIRSSHQAMEMLEELGQTSEAARARQNLALTYLVLGRNNEGLDLLDQVRDVFLADGRQRDAILVDLFVSDCLLQLRRFTEVVDSCQRIRSQFAELGTRFEVAQALLNEAVAWAGLGRHAEAKDALAEARRLFDTEGNRVWVAYADLELAALMLREGQAGESLVAAQACIALFREAGLPVKEAQADLMAARASAVLGRHAQSLRHVANALAIAEAREIPSLTYQCHHLLGGLAAARGEVETALAEYAQAVRELESLRGRLMVEFRADFSEDKQVVYEDAVDLCLVSGRVGQALDYAERAKSRALLDLLTHRLDLSLQAKTPADGPLVEELLSLRAERDRLYRRWEGDERAGEDDWSSADESRQRTRQRVLALEKQITELWHKLLVRDADYARDASLWQVRTEPIQPYLAPDTILVEFFATHGQIVAFLVTGDTVEVHRLTGALSEVQRLVQLFWLNVRTVPRSDPDRISHLTANAQALLQQLYALVLAPFEQALGRYHHLILVPHGPLHYLPFHALHDGESYLIERHEISYLPVASLLRYCRESRPATAGLLALGHSQGGRLPHAVQEATAIAAVSGGQTFVEDEATLRCLRERAADRRALHLATHGEFRPDNPLFSGLALADGWLTTLDICNLRLTASLVTLSACQTGQNVIAGGDELLGLMRAFIYAGAASVVLSLWQVEDRSTAQLMEAFYAKLAEGWRKAAALRHAQREFLVQQDIGDPASARTRAHPYFWAPFSLVGDAGPLWPAPPGHQT